MEAERTKKQLRAFIFENGVKKVFTYPKPKRLSKLGVWMQEHPNYGEIIDMQAVMK